MKSLNDDNQTLLSSLEKRGLLEMTKAYFRTSLLEALRKDNFYNTAPSGFNINSSQIKDINAINILRLQYSLINDFLIRTKMTYTQNLFNNEIKSLVDSLIPFTDSEIIHNLNLDTKQISVLRLNSNINTSPKDLVKSTYLYQLINLHCSLIRIDNEAQTMPIPEGDIRYLSPNAKNSLSEKKEVINLDEEMKRIDDKYNKKLNLEEVLPFSKINEKKFSEYKEDCDKRYEEQLKKEIDLFKNVELANMRLEENKKYQDEIESIKKQYQNIYDRKYEEIEKLKNELKGRKSNMEKEYEKKMYDLNETITEQLRNMREENRINNSKYLDEINNLNNEKKFLEQTIENLKDKHYNEMQNQMQKLKYDYQIELEKEKNVLKEDNEKNQKILLNNYTKNNNEISQLKNQINNISSLEKNISKKELAPLKNANNTNFIKNSDILAKMSEFNHKQKKILEDLEEEQNNLNKLERFEFKNIMNDEPIVLLNQDEIDEIKRNEYYINNINERDVQRKKSQEDIVYTNYNKGNISPYKNKQNQSSTSPIGIKNNPNINKSYLNNSHNKNININTSMRNSNIGIAGPNYNNNINANKIGSGVIEENIDYENISSSQKKSGSYNNYNNNNNIQSNINNYNPNISRTSQTYKLPPINQNQNQTSYSIKEDIVESNSKSKSKIGNTSKKSNDNNINNVNNINSNNLFNKSKDKFNNINYDKNEDDEYGDGDFENNISSFNQNSELNTTKKKSNNFGRIKNQNEASMSIQEKIDKQSHMGMNDKESSDSYNDFENTRGLIKKGINEGSNNFNNMSKFKTSNKNDSEIKEEIEYDNEF